jgi:predicted ATP-grasp superfamily ATP-dependent carboligase
MTRVLVTDGEARSALATVRSLGRSGHTVTVTARRLPVLAAASRFAGHAVVLPSAFQETEAFLDGLSRVIRDQGIEVLIPTTDASMRAILRAEAGRLGQAILAGPERSAYDALADKGALLPRAAALGLSIPRSIEAATPADLRQAAEELGYPCVLKPHRSVVRVGEKQLSFAIRYAGAPEDLVDAYPVEAFPVLVQEKIVGPGEGVFVLMEQGQRIAAFAHRRLREKPPSGGVSVYRESIALPADLLTRCDSMLAEVQWHGPAMIEFKRSTRTGQAYLMELNGRLWGSLQLAIDAGVDFPALMVESALGHPVTPVESYRLGVRSRWEWGDVDHLIARLIHSRRTLWLGPDAPGLPRVLWDFLHFFRRGDRLEVFERDDPGPFWRESIDWFRGRGT